MLNNTKHIYIYYKYIYIHYLAHYIYIYIPLHTLCKPCFLIVINYLTMSGTMYTEYKGTVCESVPRMYSQCTVVCRSLCTEYM